MTINGNKTKEMVYWALKIGFYKWLV